MPTSAVRTTGLLVLFGCVATVACSTDDRPLGAPLSRGVEAQTLGHSPLAAAASLARRDAALTAMLAPRAASAAWVARGDRLAFDGDTGEALHRLPKEKRHVSTMVLNISESLSKEINDMVEKFREEVFRKVESDRNPQRIMQLSVAYVPKSRIKG